MTYGMQADGPVHGLEVGSVVFGPTGGIEKEAVRIPRYFRSMMVPHWVMVSQIEAAVLAERSRCANIADDCFNRGVWPGKIAAKIRSGE